MATCNIILATWNGAQHLTAQLDSLMAQTRPPSCIVWRDDGSTDGTQALVRAWASRHPELRLIEVERQERLGPCRSFLSALRQAPPADLHMFCDQDDVWLPFKVERAMDALASSPSQRPRLYASRLQVVGPDLAVRQESIAPARLDFGSAVAESVLTGCTMGFNEPLRELLIRRVPERAVMHDWWCYLLATGAGELIFDDQPTLKYRQHSSNAIGASVTGPKLWWLRWARFTSGPTNIRSAQLNEFAQTFGDLLGHENGELCAQLVASPTLPHWQRCATALKIPVARQTSTSTWTTRLAIASGRF